MMPGRLITSALVLAAGSVLLSGCSTSSNYGAFEKACEEQVSPAVVAQWQKDHDDVPWNVAKIESTKSKEGSESNSDSKVVYVSGTASVKVGEDGGDTRKASWSCFSQQPEGGTHVSAAIRSLAIR